MKLRILGTSMALALSMTSFGAAAQNAGISYTYVELDYVNSSWDFDAGDTDSDGIELAGSLQISDYMHILGSFEYADPDDIELEDDLGNPFSVEIGDTYIWGVGFGFHTPVSAPSGRANMANPDSYSLYFDARYLNLDPDEGSSQSGWDTEAGVRLVNQGPLEFQVYVNYQDFEDVDGEVGVGAQIRYSVTPRLQLQFGGDWNDLRNTWNIGGRYHFNPVSWF